MTLPLRTTSLKAKHVSRVARIMATVLFFTPIYAVPAMAIDAPPCKWTGTWQGPDGVCFQIYNNNCTYGLFVPMDTVAEWQSFYNHPGVASLSGCSGGLAGGCFLARAQVAMADGTFKNIEDVLPGELVRGRYGEPNIVLALDQVRLGERHLCRINGDHITTDDHPHWTLRGPKMVYPRLPQGDPEYRNVVLVDGEKFSREVSGFARPIGSLMEEDLLVGLHGSVPFSSLERVLADPETPLYNLILGGSHTYYVNGYLAAGWPREDDFDYERWQPLPDLIAERQVLTFVKSV